MLTTIEAEVARVILDTDLEPTIAVIVMVSAKVELVAVVI